MNVEHYALCHKYIKCVFSWMKEGDGGGCWVGLSKPGILFLQLGVNQVRNAAPDRTTGSPPPPPTNSTLFCI